MWSPAEAKLLATTDICKSYVTWKKNALQYCYGIMIFVQTKQQPKKHGNKRQQLIRTNDVET